MHSSVHACILTESRSDFSTSKHVLRFLIHPLNFDSLFSHHEKLIEIGEFQVPMRIDTRQ